MEVHLIGDEFIGLSAAQLTALLHALFLTDVTRRRGPLTFLPGSARSSHTPSMQG